MKGFPGDSDGKESTYNAGDQGSIVGSGRSPREGNGYIKKWKQDGVSQINDSPDLDPQI